MTYLCLHFTRNHEELKSNTSYPEDSIHRIEDYLKILEDIERVIIEYLVKISKKARILELKMKKYEDYCSDILYAVSLKEDTAYLCLHFIKDHEGIKSNTPYPGELYTPYSI
ncbi:hypothetical protein Tco_1508312 [Tanacetum coccineum]